MRLKKSAVQNIALLLRNHLLLLSIGVVFLVGGTVVNLAVPALVREVLNRYGLVVVNDHLSAFGVGIAALFALQSVCFYGRSYIFGLLGQRVAASLRGRLYESTLRQSLDFFDASRTADLVSRLTADTASIQDAVSIRFSVLVRYALQVLLGVALMAFLSIKLTLIVVAVLILLVGISILLGRKLRKISRAQQQALGAASVVAHETFEAVRVVKAFDREKEEVGRFTARNDEVLQLGLDRTTVSAFFQAFVSFLLNTALALLILYGVVEVSRGDLPVGDLTAFLAYGGIVAVSFSFIAGSFAELSQALGASERVFDVLNIPTPPLTRGAPVSITAQRGGELRFEAVNFSYPARPDAQVLHDLTFDIPHGKTLALVGPSGAGKSTVVNLLLRFYDPTSGAILLNNVDLRDLAPTELRRTVSYVPQEPELFGVSIAENLRYGKAAATDKELEEICNRAGIFDFINQLPEKFNTVVGDRGTQLSGGQKQRIAIARAMLRDPEILLLDEATSALDSENEALVQRALDELLKGRTALIIAHRLSTIKNADSVVVLDKGRVVQIGNHDSLTRVAGLYRSLVDRQELLGAA